MEKKGFSRREFLKKSGAGSMAVAGVVASVPAMAQSAPVQFDRHAVFAAVGDTLIPTDPGDPGYKSLETHKITDEVMKGLVALKDDDLVAFNDGCAAFFAGRSFVQLTEPQRAEYLRIVIDGSKFSDKAKLRVIQRVYRQTRTRVFDVFYRNYPENVIPRDANEVPVLRKGDLHQITNPNTTRLKTGWDLSGFKGQMTWEEEEAARARYKRIAWGG